MQTKDAIKIYSTYLISNTRPNTIRSFSYTLDRFDVIFGARDLFSITDVEIVKFINSISGDSSASTKNSRIGTIRAFFNFIIDVTESEAKHYNPCLKPIIKKLFKAPKFSPPSLLEKDLVDEIIFRTTNEKDRLILELMARVGMRIGEVLNINVADINFDNLTVLITSPKSGRSGEKVYLPKKLSGKLYSYISKNKILNKVFDVSYSTVHRMVKSSGLLVKAKLSPHDLRRHAATQASRNNIPLEIVSKVILRHADISTTQRYLGTIDPSEASRWVEHLNR